MPLDRVQPLKLEDPETGGTETDEFPTEVDYNEDYIDCRGITAQNDTSNDDAVVISRDASNNLTFKDGVTALKTLAQLAAGTGMTPEDHRILDQLVHSLAEDYYEEYTYNGSQVTACVTWETSEKLRKIREEQYSYTGNKVTEVVTIKYDDYGDEVERLTETYTYSGSKLDNVTAVRSTP